VPPVNKKITNEIQELMEGNIIRNIKGVKYNVIVKKLEYGSLKIVYYSRAHKMEMELELKYGLYKRTIPNAKSILRDQKYRKAADLLNYKFDLAGLNRDYHKSIIGNSSLERLFLGMACDGRPESLDIECSTL
jgi:hypothetical protein